MYVTKTNDEVKNVNRNKNRVNYKQLTYVVPDTDINISISKYVTRY